MTDKQAALLPCPFCGGEVKFVNGDFSSPFEVRCTNCTEYQHTKLISWRGDADKKCNTRQALNGDCGGGDVYRLCHDAYEIYAGMEGFIPETAPEGYALQVIEQLGTAIGKAKIAALTALNGGKICAGKDELCPCQDGDMCHYKGENPFPIPSPVVDVESLKEPPTAIRLTDYSKGYGDGWNKCIDELAARGLIGHYLPKGDE